MNIRLHTDARRRFVNWAPIRHHLRHREGQSIRRAARARELDAPIFMPLDVAQPGDLEAVFSHIGKEWGALDMLVHSIAWAHTQDLQERLAELLGGKLREGDGMSCHSFIPNGAPGRAADEGWRRRCSR